ncbi:MAG: hypothetical protein V4736_02170 [Bdellovibrionota bacterium]
MRNLLFSCLFVLCATSQADEPKSQTVEAYQCEIILATEDIPVEEADWFFEVPAVGPSHGGTPQSFTRANHQVDVSADGHWMTISWQKNNKLVAQGLFVMSPDDYAQNRVVILFNPDGNGEQLSMGCNAILPTRK